MAPAVSVARVVAVVAELASGRTRVGSGYLLDATRVLTAWHCVVDDQTGRAPVSLSVVRASDGATAEVVVTEAAPRLDVALLALTGDPPWRAELPGGPAAFGRLDREQTGQLEGCEAVGFPAWQSGTAGLRDVAEVHGVIRVLEGRESQRLVLRDPVLAGVLAADGGPPWAGFSGAAVFYGGLLLGVVIEHHARQGGTALQIRPVEAIAAASDDLARRLAEVLGIGKKDALRPVTAMQGHWRPEAAGETALAQWGWSLASDREGVRHWRPRARGVNIDSEQGWRFRGRTAALRRITSWLDRPQPDRRVLVVTGSPGAGKSAVLGRVITTADSAIRGALLASVPRGDAGVLATPESVSCGVHAKGKTALEVAEEIARAARAALPGEAGDLAPAIRDALAKRPGSRFNAVIDALDEAASPAQARIIIDSVVLPLAETCSDIGVQVAVGTRRRDDGGDLLDRFGPALDLLDLDDPQYFAAEDLAAYALACLQLADDERPGNPYADNRIAIPLATRIAQVSEQNFLIAGLIARSHGLHDEQPADPASLGAETTVRTALAAYLSRLPDVAGVPASGLLTALAFAEAPGLAAGLWQLAIRGLYGADVSAQDLARFARSSAANFLVETGAAVPGPPDPGVTTVYRLFHQALNDALLHDRADFAPRRADERSLVRAFAAYGQAGQWQDAPDYLLRSLPAHAHAAALVDDLLTDDTYLLAVDPARLVPHLDTARSDPARAAAAVYRQGAHLLPRLDRAARASQLELTAHQLGYRSLAARIAEAAPDRPWQTIWSHTPHTTDHQVLSGHTLRVNSMAVGALPDGTPVIITGSRDGTVRVWRLADGAPVGEPLADHDGTVRAVAAGAMPDGTQVIATISGAGTVRVWRLADGGPVGQPLSGHRNWVDAVAVGVLPDGTPVIVTQIAGGTVRVWRLADGAPVGEPLRGHGSLNAVAVGVLPDGAPVIITSSDRLVWVRRLADGAPVGEPLRGHGVTVDAVALGVLPDGAPVIMTGSRDGTVRVWRLADGAPVGEPLRGRIGERYALAVGGLPDGTPVAVSSGDDGTVRVWRLADGRPVGEPLRGHDHTVRAVAVGVLPDGTPVIVSGADDDTVRVWRLDDGAPVGKPLRGRDPVDAVAMGTLRDGTPVIISGDLDGMLWARRLPDGALVWLLDAEWAQTLAVGGLPDGTPVIVSGSANATVRVRRLADGVPVGEPLRGHDGPVDAVTVGVLPSGVPVIVSGGHDATVRVWRLADGAPVGEPLRGHHGTISAVASVRLPDGTPLVVTGGSDATVRVWQLADGIPPVPPLDLSNSVQGVAVHGNVIVTAAGADIAIHQPVLPRPVR